MYIYLTRHSKTVWNQEKRLQGHLDSPLTTEGIENAKALKRYIQDQHIHFDYIFSSPILRAYQTALMIDENIIQDDRLKEMNFGIFEGQKISELLLRNDHLYSDLWHHPDQFTSIPEGESYEEVMVRAQSFLNDLKKYEKDCHILIVTHGMFFIIILALMLGLEKKDLVKINQKVVEGCSLTLVQEQAGDYHIVYYNRCDFLPYISHIDFAK